MVPDSHIISSKDHSTTRMVILVVMLMIMGIGFMSAQAEKGDFMLGSDLGSGIITPGSNGLFGFNFGLNQGAGFNVGISPKAGYFITDNILVGGVVLGLHQISRNQWRGGRNDCLWHTGPLRYYILPTQFQVEDLPRRGLFFIENNAGVAGVNINDGASTNGFAFGTGPGYSLFVTDNVALGLTAKYNGLVGGGDTTYQHS